VFMMLEAEGFVVNDWVCNWLDWVAALGVIWSGYGVLLIFSGGRFPLDLELGSGLVWEDPVFPEDTDGWV
jgi:hypothetical protein